MVQEESGGKGFRELAGGGPSPGERGGRRRSGTPGRVRRAAAPAAGEPVTAVSAPYTGPMDVNISIGTGQRTYQRAPRGALAVLGHRRPVRETTVLCSRRDPVQRPKGSLG